MNLVEYLPILERQDKQYVINLLSEKGTKNLIDLIFLLHEEIQKIYKLVQQPKQKYQKQQKEYEELCQKYDILFKDHNGLFDKYQKLLIDHREVVGHFENVIAQFKKQNMEDFVKTIKSKEETLAIYQNLKLYIAYELEYQQEINQINQSFKEIQQKGQELITEIQKLDDDNQQIFIYNQDQITEQQRQNRNNKMAIISQQIKAIQEKYQNQITILNLIHQKSQDENLKEQIKNTLSLIQLNCVLFKKVQYILPSQYNLIQKYEQQAEHYKEQLLTEQKHKENYQKRMQEYKNNYEKIVQSRNDNQKENQSSKQMNCLNHCYGIYLKYLTLILNLIEIQNVKQPQIQQDIERCRSQLDKQFKDIKQLIELTQNLFASVMVLANYIKQDNNILDILNTWKQFFKIYSDLLKELSE